MTSKKTKINGLNLQIVSDLHLEFRPTDLDFLIPTAPILCLLGDICVLGTDEDFKVYKTFIETITPKYDMILHVPGNHEYYNKTQRGKDTNCTLDLINKKLKDYAKLNKKLIILNNNMIRLEVNNKRYNIIGTTLWTHVDKNNYKEIQDNMNDYMFIHVMDKLTNQPRKFQVEDMQKLHKKALSSVKRFITISKKDKAKCILLTHHKAFILPKGVNENKHTNICAQAYESDLSDTLFVHPIIFAAYGHTHQAFNAKVNNIHTVSNPRGYPHQKTKFNPRLCFTV